MPKIAFPTDDGETISAHLGRARMFLVAAYEADAAPSYELRGKPQHGAPGHHTEPESGDIELHADHGVHGHDAHTGHGGMLASVADCQVLIAGGMGQPAYEGAKRMGLAVVLTGEKRIADALAAYRAGGLISDMRRVHAH